MTKDQEARLLNNQAMIMVAISTLAIEGKTGSEYVAKALTERANEITTYIKKHLQ